MSLKPVSLNTGLNLSLCLWHAHTHTHTHTHTHRDSGIAFLLESGVCLIVQPVPEEQVASLSRFRPGVQSVSVPLVMSSAPLFLSFPADSTSPPAPQLRAPLITPFSEPYLMPSAGLTKVTWIGLLNHGQTWQRSLFTEHIYIFFLLK